VRLLLDSCTFLWLIWDEAPLSPVAREAIMEPGNQVWLSAASIWEITIKHLIGRLDVRSDVHPDTFYRAQRAAHGIEPLPVREEDISHLPKLPDLHRDPFDRILICQAIAEGLTLVTPDETIRRYPVRTLW
jgi:PIN domain nuclease of toxin-antitoxin system